MNLKLNFWNATNFFRDLTTRNKFATAHGFAFARVSGLEGFEEEGVSKRCILFFL